MDAEDKMRAAFEASDKSHITNGNQLHLDWFTWQKAWDAALAAQAQEGPIEPVAWAIFAKNGNIRLWSSNIKAVQDCAKESGRPLTPLYTRPSPASAQAAVPTQAARDVLAERRRQISVEGWTPEHDDEHSSGAMANAAACYALHTEPVGNVGDYLRFWPWGAGWWMPKDRRRNLVKAGALILAEIERLDRAAATAQQGGGE